MEKVILLLAALICLQVVALAEPDNATMGPFNVTFELNTTKNLVSHPQDTDVYDDSVHYHLEIIDPSSPATIGITINKFNTPVEESLEHDAESLAKLFGTIESDVTTEYRTIDSNSGYVVRSRDDHGRLNCIGYYRLDDKTDVVVRGNMPEVENVINTIHVNRLA
jgi:hypothetical protein